MTEESRLVVAVDSASVPRATAELDKLTAASARAEAATGKLAQSSRTSGAAQAAAAGDVSRAERAASKYAETEAEAAARIHDMVQASLAARDAIGAQATVQQAAAAKVAEGNAAQVAATRDLVAAQNAQMAATSAIVRAEAAGRAAAQQGFAILAQKRITSTELAKAETLLNQAEAAGVIQKGAAVAAFKALDEAKIKDIAVTEAVVAANKSAFTLNSRATSEIATGLSEVLSGNVGRLRRTGAAFLNQSGVLSKLLTPAGLGITAGVASIGALVAAYVSAEREADNFTRAIYATGQQGAITSSQLQTMAEEVGESTGSYGDAAKAILVLANSGEVAQDQYKQLGKTLVNFASLTGGSLQDGMRAIDSLTGEVGDGLVKLNSQYHFLTATVYDQITALQAQGETEKARDLERRAFADAVNQSADDVKSHLDPLARAWDEVGSAASTAWHKMAQGTRDGANGVVTTIEGYFSDLKDVASRFANPMATVFNGGLSPREVAASQTATAASSAAQADALRKKATQTLAEFGAEAAKYKSAAQKRAADIIRVTAQTNAAIANALAAGDKELADKIRKSGASLEEAIAAQGAASSPHSRRGGRAADDYLASFQDTYTKMVSKGADALNKQTAAQAKAQVGNEAYAQQLATQLLLRENAINLQVEAVGMGQKEIQRMQEKNQVYQDFNRQLKQLNNERDRGSISIADYETRLQDLKDAEAGTIAAIEDGWKRIDAAQSSATLGMTAAMQDWINQGKDVAGMTAQTFTDAFGNMNDALVNFVQTGKLNFADLGKSIIADLTRMELRIAESKILSSLLWSVGGYEGAAESAATETISSLGYAKGGVFDSPSLSRYSNGVYDTPQFFTYAKGGVFAEAGPEAIMPLSRGPDGKLGVKAQGGGGDVIVNVQNNGGQPAQVSQSKDGNGNDIITVMINAAANEVDSRIMRGGSTYKAINQTFGVSRRGIPVAG